MMRAAAAHAPYIDAILSSPDDPDKPIRDYADWLEERGEEDRARLIRLEQTRDALSVADPRRIETEIQISGIMQRIGYYEDTPLRRQLKRLCLETDKRQGITREATLKFEHPEDVDEKIAKLYELAPINALVTWDLSERAARRLARRPELRYLTEIQFSGLFSNWKSAELVLDSPHLTNVQGIRFSQRQLRGLPLAKWLQNLPAPKLRQFSIVGVAELLTEASQMSTADVEALLECPRLEDFDLFELSAHHLDDQAAKAIADCPHLRNVKRLLLSLNRIGNEGAEALANSPNFPSVETFNLCYNLRVGDGGAAKIAESEGLGNLVELKLEGNRLSDRGLRKLMDSTHFPNLANLDLTQCGIRFNKPELFRDMTFCRQRINYLRLGRIPFENLQTLVNWPALERASLLSLNKMNLNDEHAAILADSSRLSGLMRLDLAENKITKDGMEILAQSPFLEDIQEIHLFENKADEAECQAVRDRYGPRIAACAIPKDQVRVIITECFHP